MPPKKVPVQSAGQSKLSFGSKPKNTDETRINAPKQGTLELNSKKRGIEQISNASQDTKKESPQKKLKVVEEEKTGNEKDSKNLQTTCDNSARTPSKKDSKSDQQALKSAQNSKQRVEVNLPYKDYETLRPLSDPNFCPEVDSPQSKDQRMPFSFLVKALQLIETTEGKNSRTMIIEIFTNIFRSALVNFPEELADILYFFIVKLAPDFKAMETGVGHEMSVKAIAKACGKTPKEIRDIYKEEGDLGSVVQKGKSTQGTLGGFFKKQAGNAAKKQLIFTHVFSEFRKIAKTSGNNSAAMKDSIIVKLLQDASNDEAKYIVRFLQKTLKTGAAEKTVIVALARAIVYTPPNKPKILNQKKKLGETAFLEKCQQVEHSIKQAICEAPDYDKLVEALMICGDNHEKIKDHCHIKVGIPVKPMLAKPTKGVHVILQRFQGISFTCEYKYDGFRGQIHYNRKNADSGNDCHIYSRNLENMSVAYPDVLDIIREVANEKPNIENFIIDSELVAYDIENQQILPFQTLTQRSRKHVNEKDLQTKIAIQAFDLLYLNDKSMLPETLEDRRQALRDTFGELSGKFMFAKGTDTSNFEDLESYLDQSIKDRCEGLMVKTLNVNSTYMPSQRSFNWLKLKKDYLDTALGDSVDLCVVGADHGQGKRAGWFGSFLLASWNDDLECFQTICKVGTGLSEELLAKLKTQLDEIIINKPANSLKLKDNMPQIKCDVYFEPKYVWEIKAADLSLSPMHTTAIGNIEEGKGIALRFPRMIRVRDDKQPMECTNTEQITEMYRSQASIQVNFKDDDDFDF